MGKKNLEQLFKDTFKDFHQKPDEKVWNSIEATLDRKKQKKRVVPIWWRLGGVAALLALLFYVINPLDKADGSVETIITEVENEDASPQIEVVTKDSLNAKDPFDGTQKETVTDASKETQKNDDRNTGHSGNNNRPHFDSKDGLATRTHDQEENHVKNAASDVSDFQENKETSLVSDSDANKEKESIILENVEGKEAIAERTSENPNSKKNFQYKSLDNEKEVEEVVAQNDPEEKELEKKSIFDAIAEQEEEIEVADASQNKWSVGPSLAPVYFNGSGEGSPIHSNFASNSKSGNVNLSYGLTVAYNIGKRLKVRSGVHRVNYGYDTNDVIFSSSLESSTNQTIDNINYSETSRTLVVQSKNDFQGRALNDASVELAANEVPALEGKMVQQLGYIEVPLELNYTLVDKKLGVALIGGVSSLFLVENSVLLESQDLVTEMGEANNANSVNYSTNIGIGLNYEISPKLQFNLEPVFKYQLNTFSETAGPFRPYSVGVYSGVSLRF
ncbi:outer membrane beta-barrel protein [Flagellimonas meishanensis]|uniref:outer membrane beta-barrel protein n=1 Tax=Flagellimonas meishanensis TaxID=2873264 RepID=UPI001CA65FD9|nr:outer membrane beta-barrel protein [[Muricauda] meishanensis]